MGYTLDRYKFSQIVVYHPALNAITGDIKATLLLEQVIYWSARCDGPEFWKSQDEWTEEVGFTRRETDRARAILVDGGLVTERYDRLNHRMYYALNEAALDRAVEAMQRPQEGESGYTQRHSPMDETDTPERTKGAVGSAQKAQSYIDQSLHTEPTSQPIGHFPKRREPEVDTEFIARLVTEYADLLGGDGAVSLEITKALNNKALDKAKNKRLYLHTWLRQAVKWRDERSRQHNGNGRRNGQREMTRAESDAIMDDPIFHRPWPDEVDSNA